MADNFCELTAEAEKSSLLEAILSKQAEDTGLSKEELLNKAGEIVNVMKNTISKGLKSKEKSLSSLSGKNTSLFSEFDASGLISPLCRKAMLYSLATIEENARMGRIAACPTAGSSGIVPAVLIAYAEEFNISFEKLSEALIVAGEVGRIISLKMQLAGAVGGCQAECGVASAMASAGLCYMAKASLDVVFNAVALNLKNIMGLTCDPVAGLVEVPCVKRNIFLASHAIVSSCTAMSGIKSCIPLDEVVDAMKETGMLMSPKLKESAEAGLATTKTGIEISNKLQKIWNS